jgi:hypothetical protein
MYQKKMQEARNSKPYQYLLYIIILVKFKTPPESLEKKFRNYNLLKIKIHDLSELNIDDQRYKDNFCFILNKPCAQLSTRNNLSQTDWKISKK